jgi:hypothetical protein
MLLSDWASVAALFMAILALGGVVFSVLRGVYSTGVRLATIELKVDTMWDFQLRRATNEAVHRGIATLNSPLVFNDDAMKLIEPLKGDVLAVYAAVDKPIAQRDLAVALESKLGERILHEVCLPHGLFMGSCLLMALEMIKRNAKDGDIIERAA